MRSGEIQKRNFFFAVHRELSRLWKNCFPHFSFIWLLDKNWSTRKGAREKKRESAKKDFLKVYSIKTNWHENNSDKESSELLFKKIFSLILMKFREIISRMKLNGKFNDYAIRPERDLDLVGDAV